MKKIKKLLSILLIFILFLIYPISSYAATIGEDNGGAQGPSNTLVHSERHYT